MQHKGSKTLGIIPARYASTRFPGKPLVDIQGKSMIRRVYEQATKATSLDEIIVATDDIRILEHVQSWNGQAMMTATEHQSGTDRCAEILAKQASNIQFVVNIQGDEPFIQPEQIDYLINNLQANIVQQQIATLAKRIDNQSDIHNANIVKVVFDATQKALYFSRNPIPFVRGIAPEEWLTHGEFYKHIGLYAFEANTLLELVKLPQSRLEKTESLEQLRWLENGYNIHVGLTDLETKGIDTPEDLLRL